MLILTRRIGEAIMVGEDVEIRILGMKGNQTRIGINAPKDIPVHREEIKRRIDAEKELIALIKSPSDLSLNHIPVVVIGNGKIKTGTLENESKTKEELVDADFEEVEEGKNEETNNAY